MTTDDESFHEGFEDGLYDLPGVDGSLIPAHRILHRAELSDGATVFVHYTGPARVSELHMQYQVGLYILSNKEPPSSIPLTSFVPEREAKAYFSWCVLTDNTNMILSDMVRRRERE